MALLHYSPADTTDRLTLIGVGIVFTSLGLAVIALRVLAILLRHRPVGNDDWAMLLAWLTSIGFAIASWISVRWGVGLRTTDQPPFIPGGWEMKAIKAVFVIEIFYYLAMFFLKMSILSLYLRLSNALRNTFWKSTLVTMAVILAQFTATMVVVRTQCQPTAKYWRTSLSGHCVSITAFFYCNPAPNPLATTATNIFTILTDLLILGLPIPTLLRLNQPRAQKLGLLAAFLVGGVSTLASCIRLYSVALYTESKQPLRDAATINTWSFIEINLGILCASVPAIKPLFLPPKRVVESRYYCNRPGAVSKGEAGSSGSRSRRQRGLVADPFAPTPSSRSLHAIEMSDSDAHAPPPPTSTNDRRASRDSNTQPRTLLRAPMERFLSPSSTRTARRPMSPPEPALVNRRPTDHYQVSASRSSRPATLKSFGSTEIMVSRGVEVEGRPDSEEGER